MSNESEKGILTVMPFDKRIPFIRLKFGTFELSAYGTSAIATVLALSILLWVGRWRGLL
jgi:hypothetical protein